MIFISYSKEDQAPYTSLCVALESEHLPYWNPTTMKAGASLKDQLKEAISKCDICIFIATRSSVKSKWCLAETGAFWGAGKAIILYKANPDIDERNIPPLFQGALWTCDARAVIDQVKEALSKSTSWAQAIADLMPYDKGQIINALLAYLRNDQDHSGLHRGQFGRGQRVLEEERYQTTKEKLDTKPRLYLTGWPVFILLKNRGKIPSEQMLELAESGALALFSDHWIHISMGAHRYTNPAASGHTERVISYRHTIRAAQILLSIDNTSSIPKGILGKMLDSSTDMYTKEGGWRQCNIDFRDEDLWGSAYAAGFLHSCLHQAGALGLDSNAANKATKLLERTLAWLHKKWTLEAWVYDKVPTEENATIIFPEIASAAIEYRPKLATAVLSCLGTYIDPTCQPISSYLKKNSMVGPCAASARLAYNLYITKQFRNDDNIRWQALRDYALQHRQHGFNCVEAAMLLEMLLVNARGIADGVW